MARPYRIEYPGAVYHVMNRGADHQTIFPNGNYHRAIFRATLEDAVNKWKILIHAYSLMDNHYHLLVETPLGNISRAMRHIDGVYTQKLNKTMGRDGPLFRGRFKSILAEKESYFLELVRYIHMNGVKAGHYATPDKDIHSSHPAYLNPEKAPSWLETKMVLSYFQGEDGRDKERLDQFVRKEIPDEINKVYASGKWPAVLGKKGFVDQIKDEFLSTDAKPHPEIPQQRSLVLHGLLKPEVILKTLSRTTSELNQLTPAGRTRLQKWLTIYFLKEYSQQSYREIGLLMGGRPARVIERFYSRNNFRGTPVCQQLTAQFQVIRLRPKMSDVET